MGPKTKELVHILGLCIELLKKHKVTFWANKLESSLIYINQSDFYGVETLLSNYGGMGSFNDLVIYAANGFEITKNEEPGVNKQFDFYRSKIYELAMEIKGKPTISNIFFKRKLL